MIGILLLAFSLGYIFCGLMYALIYLLAFKPQTGTAYVGLMVLFFPVYLIIDVVLVAAHGLGQSVTLFARRFKA